jgi:hypothetical protein
MTIKKQKLIRGDITHNIIVIEKNIYKQIHKKKQKLITIVHRRYNSNQNLLIGAIKIY